MVHKLSPSTSPDLSRDSARSRSSGRVLAVPALCLVTDRRFGSPRVLIHKVAEAVQGGVTMVQVREKDPVQPLSSREFLSLAKELRQVTLDKAPSTSPHLSRDSVRSRSSGQAPATGSGQVLLVINDRVDIALASDADGVQVGASSLPVSVARRLLGDTRLVGCSVHSVEEARQAEADGADFLIVGTVFETTSHLGKEPEGLGLVRQVRGAVRIPILGIGGITAANAAQVMQAGAKGVAVISAVLGAEDPAGAARELRAALETALPLSRAGA